MARPTARAAAAKREQILGNCSRPCGQRLTLEG